MNVRQERFAELVASGVPAMRAYAGAGYSNTGKNAEANATRMMGNEGVKERIAELRQENRQLARKTKEQKLARLEEIAWDEKAKHSDVIAALRTHNEMTGDNEPTVNIVKTGPNTLASLQERAKEVRSYLNLAYRNRQDRKADFDVATPASVDG
jgi:NADH dehydrogenase/NADH:ubiquinone oxidoreductase subunit G